MLRTRKNVLESFKLKSVYIRYMYNINILLIKWRYTISNPELWLIHFNHLQSTDVKLYVRKYRVRT